MHLFKSSRPNLLHFVTSVTYKRVPIFLEERFCELFVEALKLSKEDRPFNLLGYVVMPDHVHLLINPLDKDIRRTMNAIKGRSAAAILKEMRRGLSDDYLDRLSFMARTGRRQTHKVWQTGFSSIDVSSEKFIRQKLKYIHLNPVRAGLIDHPARWRFSSFAAYLPHRQGDVPMEIDSRGYWNKDELR